MVPRRRAGPRLFAVALLFGCVLSALLVCGRAKPAANNNDSTPNRDGHTNNWAVIVGTSRFWYNYRHVSNALSVYRTVRRLGIPDSNIILMLADDIACNPRNAFPGRIFQALDHRLDVYANASYCWPGSGGGGGGDERSPLDAGCSGGAGVEVDYRGYEVTVESFLRVLTGRHSSETPRHKRLLSDEQSNILIYLTGHGGEDFIKFQNIEDVNSHDIADALAQMRHGGRYREVLFVVDTCQAASLYRHFYAPDVFAVGSSMLGENSYSYQTDPEVGASLMDRMTFHMLAFMERQRPDSRATVADLLAALPVDRLASHVHSRGDLFSRPASAIRLLDFFGARVSAHIVPEAYPSGGGDKGDADDDDDVAVVTLFNSPTVVIAGGGDGSEYFATTAAAAAAAAADAAAHPTADPFDADAVADATPAAVQQRPPAEAVFNSLFVGGAGVLVAVLVALSVASRG